MMISLKDVFFKYKYYFIALVFFILVLSFIIYFFLINKSSGQSSNNQIKDYVINNSIPIPQSPRIEEDDLVATLFWNEKNEDGSNSTQNPENVVGYLITWGEDNNSNLKQDLTSDRIIQLQPLDAGKEYFYYIQSINSDGEVSPKTEKKYFHSDNSRVQSLKSKMNAFFDDFNYPEGPFNELKWNNAYSGCASPGTGSQFINNQFHAHNVLFSGTCDRGENESRPRQIFDFTNRTGTIVFDFDGAVNRDQWYLDLNDIKQGPIDISGHVDLEDINGKSSYPINTLRIHQNGDSVKIFYFDDKGIEMETTPKTQNLCGTTGLTYCEKNLSIVNNVRRHWEIKIAKNSVEVKIDGILVADANINLPFEQAYLNWIAFSYNTPKSNEKSSLIHWDNFGFDGPATFIPTVTHNYTDGFIGTEGGSTENNNYSYPETSYDNPLKRNIKIPDDISQAKNIRLQFTLQNATGNKFQNNIPWDGNDKVIINNKSIVLSKPNIVADIELASAYSPYSYVLNVPQNYFTQGDNNIEFYLDNVSVLNIHAEFDFSSDYKGDYSQPVKIWGEDWMKKIMHHTLDIGPSVTIQKINGKNLDISGTVKENQDIKAQVTNSINLDFEISNVVSMVGTGKNYGIQKYEILIDNNVIYSFSYDENHVPVPYLNKNLTIDISKLCKGKHELYIRAYNKNGNISNTNYFQGDDVDIQYNNNMTEIKNGYYPVYINVENDLKCS